MQNADSFFLLFVKAHKTQVAEREQLIHEISEKHKIKGFNYSPLEREKAHEFLSRLDELRRKQNADLERIQVCGFPFARQLRD
jgi:DNA repair protein RAD50